MSELVAVVTDLFFQSRIMAAARARGLEVRFLSRDVERAALKPESVVFVDLDARLDAIGAIRQLKIGGAFVIAFGPHLDAEKLKAARAAGADRVLAKSKFVSELPKLVASASESKHGNDSLQPEQLHVSEKP